MMVKVLEFKSLREGIDRETDRGRERSFKYKTVLLMKTPRMN